MARNPPAGRTDLDWNYGIAGPGATPENGDLIYLACYQGSLRCEKSFAEAEDQVAFFPGGSLSPYPYSRKKMRTGCFGRE